MRGRRDFGDRKAAERDFSDDPPPGDGRGEPSDDDDDDPPPGDGRGEPPSDDDDDDPPPGDGDDYRSTRWHRRKPTSLDPEFYVSAPRLTSNEKRFVPCSSSYMEFVREALADLGTFAENDNKEDFADRHDILKEFIQESMEKVMFPETLARGARVLRNKFLISPLPGEPDDTCIVLNDATQPTLDAYIANTYRNNNVDDEDDLTTQARRITRMFERDFLPKMCGYYVTRDNADDRAARKQANLPFVNVGGFESRFEDAVVADAADAQEAKEAMRRQLARRRHAVMKRQRRVLDKGTSTNVKGFRPKAANERSPAVFAPNPYPAAPPGIEIFYEPESGDVFVTRDWDDDVLELKTTTDDGYTVRLGDGDVVRLSLTEDKDDKEMKNVRKMWLKFRSKRLLVATAVDDNNTYTVTVFSKYDRDGSARQYLHGVPLPLRFTIEHGARGRFKPVFTPVPCEVDEACEEIYPFLTCHERLKHCVVKPTKRNCPSWQGGDLETADTRFRTRAENVYSPSRFDDAGLVVTHDATPRLPAGEHHGYYTTCVPERSEEHSYFQYLPTLEHTHGLPVRLPNSNTRIDDNQTVFHDEVSRDPFVIEGDDEDDNAENDVRVYFERDRARALGPLLNQTADNIDDLDAFEGKLSTYGGWRRDEDDVDETEDEDMA